MLSTLLYLSMDAEKLYAEDLSPDVPVEMLNKQTILKIAVWQILAIPIAFTLSLIISKLL